MLDILEVFERCFVGVHVRVGVEVTILPSEGRAVGPTGATTSAHVGRLLAAGAEGLHHDVGLGAAGVRAQVAGRQVRAAVAAAHGRAVDGRTLARATLARGQPAADHAVRAEVTRHVVAVGRWQLSRFRCSKNYNMKIDERTRVFQF